jgi:hypothetical protein
VIWWERLILDLRYGADGSRAFVEDLEVAMVI